MNQSDINYFIEQLKANGTGFDAGLSNTEVAAIQHRFGFVFPPDLRRLLQTALPITSVPHEILPGYGDEPDHEPPLTPFYNWRSEDETLLREMLYWPADGICSDVIDNRFWIEEWGNRPLSDEAACVIAQEKVAAAPTLIPLFGHRFMPDAPVEEGNPVLSVYQTDIIYYGFDLAQYLAREFDLENPCSEPEMPRRIAFWSTLPYMWQPAWD